jgi:hypothetical protein
MADAHDRLHLLGGDGKEDRLGHHAKHGEPVALVRAQLLTLGDQTRGADNRAKLIQDSGVHAVRSCHRESDVKSITRYDTPNPRD